MGFIQKFGRLERVCLGVCVCICESETEKVSRNPCETAILTLFPARLLLCLVISICRLGNFSFPTAAVTKNESP